MKNLLSVGAALAFLLPSIAFAQEYPVSTLQANAIICFEFRDWRDMIATSVDQDAAAASRLVLSGTCRVVPEPKKVAFIDKAGGDLGSLIQMPSGKVAHTSDAFLK